MDNKIIEEIAKEFTCIYEDDNCEYCEYRTSCIGLVIARKLYNAGYRKIPENAVVLTEEEYRQDIKDLVRSNEKTREETRKETAEKFAERLKEYFIDDFSEYEYDYLCMRIDEICKELGGENG